MVPFQPSAAASWPARRGEEIKLEISSKGSCLFPLSMTLHIAEQQSQDEHILALHAGHDPWLAVGRPSYH